MNRLARWRVEQEISQEALAEKLGVSQGHVSRLLSGARQPGRAVALAIGVLTGGLVPAASWGSSPKARTPRRSSARNTHAPTLPRTVGSRSS